MAYVIDTQRIPCLQSYEDCETWFNKTPRPNQNEWEADWRPLDRPRMLHKRLIKTEHEYRCVLYNTNMVRYFKDGSVVIQLHSSQSSRKFLSRVLPPGVNYNTDSGKMMLEVLTEDGKQWLRAPDHVFSLRPAGESWVVTSYCYTRMREFKDRSKCAKVRAKLKPFFTWYETTDRLVGWKYSEQQFPELLALSNIDVSDPKNWMYMARHMKSKTFFIDIIYRLHDAREIIEIPNSLPPIRNKEAHLS